MKIIAYGILPKSFLWLHLLAYAVRKKQMDCEYLAASWKRIRVDIKYYRDRYRVSKK